MNVILEAALFGHAEVRVLDLLSLIQLGFEGRHLVTTDPLVDEQVSAWLAARAPEESSCCLFTFNSAAVQLPRTQSDYIVRVSPGRFAQRFQRNELILCVQDALILLRSPFRVLVEDQISDGDFLLAIAQPEWRTRLLHMRANGWLCFDHGGGTRLIEIVRRSIENPLLSLALWVLFDSDSLAPGLLSEGAAELTALCRGNVAFHCLERRAIENYVPLLALQYWAEQGAGNHVEDRRRTYRAFRSMSEPAQHHYNLKHGFLGDAKRDDRENAGTIFGGLSYDQRQSLNNGFGGHIAELFGSYMMATWEWWMNTGSEREEGRRMIQALFSRL